MHRVYLWWGIILFILIHPVKASASVVLNEIFSNPENENDEFIELYNNSDTEIDLSNWKVSDLVKSFTISDLKISAKSFLVLDKTLTGLALNNSDEQVLLIDSANTEVDKFSYETTVEGKSWSRNPDGDGGFVNNTDITKGTQNVSAPTPTPTSSPTPTNTPKPTKEPTPTKVPTVTKSPTVTKIPEITTKENLNLVSPTAKSKKENNKLKKNLASNYKPTGSSVAGVSTGKNTNEIAKSDAKEGSPAYLYSVTTGLGMLILGFGIIAYKRFKNKNEEDDF